MNQMTTGASNDFEQATNMAQKMVASWGMSEELGPRTYGEREHEVFLGREMSTNRNLSNETAARVDKEVTRIIEEQYKRARDIIESHRDEIDLMARSLLELETLEASQIDEIMAGKKPTPPKPDSDESSSDNTGGGESDSGSSNPVQPDLDRPAGHSA